MARRRTNWTLAGGAKLLFWIVLAAVLAYRLIQMRHPKSHVHHVSVLQFCPSRETLSLQEHTYTSDGLLTVNPNGPHPIFELMQNAEAEWDRKLARASTTLAEAVAEYRRRYSRAPPLGFDKWWEFVVEHNVQLPDEFDEIYRDIEPYWGLDPEDIVRSAEEAETRDSTFTLAKTSSNDGLEIVYSTFTGADDSFLERVAAIIDLTQDFGSDLPPMRILFHPHDTPAMHTDWRIKQMALDAAARGRTIRQSQLPSVTKRGWIEGCPPDSPARLDPPDLPSHGPSSPVLPESPKTFIATHRLAMDPCQHRDLLVTHGQFLAHDRGPYPRHTLVPCFSHSATLLHHDIRPPIPYDWTSGEDAEATGDVPWSHKVDERLDWRGRTTGIYASPSSLWVHAHRQRLVALTNMMEGNVSVLDVPVDASVPVGEPAQIPIARVNPAWMDVAYVDKPLSCEERTGTCRMFEKMFEFRRVQDRKEEGRYKFIIDVDGNGWSGRFKRLMTSNALIFKATIYPEWYTSRIAEWVHYIPIQATYSDLYDAVAFFRVHDDAAAKIAAAGKDWSQQFWRKADMSAYLYRLLLEYARVTSPDRESMSYHG
ncbi:glycosyl transferase family 90-domain-containing protein [Pisolithus marmoratus]|nr:glycosyl transferase family 90-domain-containing protein [Pisolithus marmoratus]